MVDKILIDAIHEGEARAVVLCGDRVEEFDCEFAGRARLRGNIYLARVMRVEPSLQAAFVDFGGDRHGFLAFSEIHPDYYQIPLADRQRLLEEAMEEEANDESRDDEGQPAAEQISRSAEQRSDSTENPLSEKRIDGPGGDSLTGSPPVEEEANFTDSPYTNHGIPAEISGEIIEAPSTEDSVDLSLGTVDALEEIPAQKPLRRRHKYKIQEVIKRQQILLVQVVKEERGSKGAAMTTYLSIAGRYCVLMPNTDRGGGISRKVTSLSDRRKMKDVSEELRKQLPTGMGLILRTAGANRTKTEIKRDFDYLARLWETIRSLTLESTAPALIHEEGSLIKRSLRDLYSKEVEVVLVSGDKAYREARAFMRMLMPSHARFIQAYKEKKPLFSRYGVEAQLDAMLLPQVTLQSGGQIVINQTEALVAIDVNSGRSTREHDIESTALSTNLEAAEEISRQLRLRDLAGLIVVDFIDMDEKRNQRTVERKLKECLQRDRARIQVGRISHFGLLEMSRQRMRVGMLEGSTSPCPRCQGSGYVRSTESLTLSLLRAIEEALLSHTCTAPSARVNSAVTSYILNQKRAHLCRLEEQFSATITIEADDRLPRDSFVLERGHSVQGSPSSPSSAPSHVPDRTSKREAARGKASPGLNSNPAAAGGENIEEGRRGRRWGRSMASRNGGLEEATPSGSGQEGEDTGLGPSATGGKSKRGPRRRRREHGGKEGKDPATQTVSKEIVGESPSGGAEGGSAHAVTPSIVENAPSGRADGTEAESPVSCTESSFSSTQFSPEGGRSTAPSKGGGKPIPTEKPISMEKKMLAPADEGREQDDTGGHSPPQEDKTQQTRPFTSRIGWWKRRFSGEE